MTNDWTAAEERDHLYLYDLACWYAVASEVGADVGDAPDSARLYLAYSLGGDGKRDLWNWADEDEDLAIIQDEFVPRLRLELVRVRLQYPDLHRMEGEEFRETMNDVIAATRPKPLRRRSDSSFIPPPPP